MSDYPTYQELHPVCRFKFYRSWYTFRIGDLNPIEPGFNQSMKWLSGFFLRATRWQMFLLLFGTCFIGTFAGPIAIISAAPSSEILGRAQIVSIGLLAAVSELVFLSWLWFMGSFLRSAIERSLRPRESFFRIAIIYPLVFAFAGPVFIVNPNSWPLGLIVVLGLFLFVCLIYDFNFVSNALIVAETGRRKDLGEGTVTFFLLWFFPVGVWFIQPRINRLFKARGTLGISTE